jgi:hypothetical protein
MFYVMGPSLWCVRLLLLLTLLQLQLPLTGPYATELSLDTATIDLLLGLVRPPPDWIWRKHGPNGHGW